MPKRTTLTFTSEDAPKSSEDALFVYYCRYSGRHAFTCGGSVAVASLLPLASLTAHGALHGLFADVDITRLPQRRTDSARIIDLDKYYVKLYTADGGVKLIKRYDPWYYTLRCSDACATALSLCRKDGRIDRQFRLNVGKLPIAYK